MMSARKDQGLRSAYMRRLLVGSTPTTARLPRFRTTMSLIQGYSSGEDEGPVSPTNDAFGLTSLPAAKKPRTEPQKLTSVIPHSAPDVLSEVRDAFGPFESSDTQGIYYRTP